MIIANKRLFSNNKKPTVRPIIKKDSIQTICLVPIITIEIEYLSPDYELLNLVVIEKNNLGGWGYIVLDNNKKIEINNLNTNTKSFRIFFDDETYLDFDYISDLYSTIENVGIDSTVNYGSSDDWFLYFNQSYYYKKINNLNPELRTRSGEIFKKLNDWQNTDLSIDFKPSTLYKIEFDRYTREIFRIFPTEMYDFYTHSYIKNTGIDSTSNITTFKVEKLTNARMEYSSNILNNNINSTSKLINYIFQPLTQSTEYRFSEIKNVDIFQSSNLTSLTIEILKGGSIG